MTTHLKTAILAVTIVVAAPMGVALARSEALADWTTRTLMERRPSSLEVDAAGRLYNPEAPVPPQCYTRIEGRFNPCYVCHQDNDDPTRTNFTQDGSLQAAYEFSEAALANHHRNLFVDRRAAVADIPDAEIRRYADEDNYSALAERLRARGWRGWIPDLAGFADGAAAFDEHGIALDGSGWVAFNYKPQPSTFWPTNGSTDDVLIRLPGGFRTTAGGAPSRDVYLANLALLEMSFQDLTRVTVPVLDERDVGVDLDGDGSLSVVGAVERRARFVGGAADVPVVRMSYPRGTEFLHSVRYIGLDGDDRVTIARRMKELRYMVKTRRLDIAALRSRYGNEHQEKMDENLPRYIDLGDRGMDTGFGWILLGFIEDARGELRPQTDEEQFFCRGCHATTGANIDQTWAFPRKVTGAAGWGYIDYRKLWDAPNRGQSEGEILTYMRRAGGGDEFRSNREMLARWFDAEGHVDAERLRRESVYEIITPSVERALRLNKAYRVIVEEQTFIFGRDATLQPPVNVHAEIDEATAPTLPEDKRYRHDIRLDWSARPLAR